MELSVIIPTHNPHSERLRRTLAGLQAQSLAIRRWETILVNNASTHFPTADFFALAAPKNFTIVHEPKVGLNAARQRGFSGARGALAVLVDDDNVLGPDYLEEVIAVFARQPGIGIAGGKSLPDFERAPTVQEREFLPLLALRDLGESELISDNPRSTPSARKEYPNFAPIGAGMALRRDAWTAWLDASTGDGPALSDRRGSELTSGGDNDLVLCAMQAGWAVGYFPELSLTHLIPACRLESVYLARLNRGIQKSWMQVLSRHQANPWPPLTQFGADLRKAKAWFASRAWRSPVAEIRWQGACGHFDGRVASR